MMVKRETDYAIRTVLYLAMQPAGTHTTARALAREKLIPHALARRIVSRLTAAGILHSARGPSGGIALARPPAEITLLQVMQAVDGAPVVSPCVVEPASCPLMPECPVHEVWVDLQRSLETTLEHITFAQLAQRGLSLSQLPDPIFRCPESS